MLLLCLLPEPHAEVMIWWVPSDLTCRFTLFKWQIVCNYKLHVCHCSSHSHHHEFPLRISWPQWIERESRAGPYGLCSYGLSVFIPGRSGGMSVLRVLSEFVTGDKHTLAGWPAYFAGQKLIKSLWLNGLIYFWMFLSFGRGVGMGVCVCVCLCVHACLCVCGWFCLV